MKRHRMAINTEDILGRWRIRRGAISRPGSSEPQRAFSAAGAPAGAGRVRRPVRALRPVAIHRPRIWPFRSAPVSSRAAGSANGCSTSAMRPASPSSSRPCRPSCKAVRSIRPLIRRGNPASTLFQPLNAGKLRPRQPHRDGAVDAQPFAQRRAAAPDGHLLRAQRASAGLIITEATAISHQARATRTCRGCMRPNSWLAGGA